MPKASGFISVELWLGRGSGILSVVSATGATAGVPAVAVSAEQMVQRLGLLQGHLPPSRQMLPMRTSSSIWDVASMQQSFGTVSEDGTFSVDWGFMTRVAGSVGEVADLT